MLLIRARSRYEEAVQCYERAQVICPTSGPTYAGLGYASQCLGDDGRAIDCYHKVGPESCAMLFGGESQNRGLFH